MAFPPMFQSNRETNSDCHDWHQLMHGPGYA